VKQGKEEEEEEEEGRAKGSVEAVRGM